MSENLYNNHAKMIDSYKSGDLDACIDSAQQLLQSDPDSKAPLQYAARVHTQRREPALAKPYWNKLAIIAPELPEPFLQSARIARLEKDWHTCEGYIEEFIRQKPDHPEALGIHIQCLIANKHTENLGRAFSNLCRLKQSAVPPLALQAIEQGMGIEVAKALSKAAIKNPSVKALCVKLAQTARDAAIGFEIQSDLLSAAHCYQAMQIYTPESSYPRTSLKRIRKPFLQKAQAAYREKNYAAAVNHARTCIEISPFEPEPYIIAGRSSALLGKHQAAFDFLGVEIERFWDNSWLVLNYARAALHFKKPDIAYAAFNAIKNRDDEKSRLYHAECDKQLTRLSEMAAQEVQALLDNHDILRASDKIFDLQKAGLPLNNAADLVENIRDLGQSKLQELCDFEDSEALDYAKTLVRLDPDAKYANRIAGRLLLENRHYAEAHYYWSQLAKLDDKDPEPWLNLARCYANLNNKAEAMKAVSTLLMLDPGHQEGENILETLGEMRNLSSEGLS